MTDSQFYAHRWLSRMWDTNIEIEQLIARRETIIDSLSGIGKYDSEHIPTQNGENATESKNIEYSVLSEQIDKRMSTMNMENARTLQAIGNVDDSMLRGMLIARYVRRLTWAEVGKLYNYERTSIYKTYRLKALDAVSPFIPKGEITDDVS